MRLAIKLLAGSNRTINPNVMDMVPLSPNRIPAQILHRLSMRVPLPAVFVTV